MFERRPDDELRFRLRQQELLAQFGVDATRAGDLPALLQRAAELCAQGMETEFCKVLEREADADGLEDAKPLRLVAGVGWRRGAVGHATIGTDLASPAGFALKTGRAVISNHLEMETRFRTPELMREHGIRRAVNVVITNRNGPFGVLEVDSRDEGRFGEADLAFMQGFANLIGVAIERHRAETELAAAARHQEFLTLEMSHRVKNSLAIVAGLLSLQARSEPPSVARALEDARRRVDAIAQVHDQLWQQPRVGTVDLGRYLVGLCEAITAATGGVRLDCAACADLDISADRAVPLGLVVNELLTNAMKYAYPDGGQGVVRVRAARDGDGYVRVDVEDEGRGLPDGFDVTDKTRKSLGMRLVRTLGAQLDAAVEVASSPGEGARFSLRFPLEAPQAAH